MPSTPSQNRLAPRRRLGAGWLRVTPSLPLPSVATSHRRIICTQPLRLTGRPIPKSARNALVRGKLQETCAGLLCPTEVLQDSGQLNFHPYVVGKDIEHLTRYAL